MKNNVIKILILCLLASAMLFAISCTGTTPSSASEESVAESQSESVANHECEFTVLKYNKTSHWYECECGAIDSSTISGHTGGMATCQTLAVCATCGQSYGDYKEHNIVDGECTVCENQDLGLRFALGDDETYYKVIGIGDYNDKDLVIPDEYNGLPVKEIAKKAFSDKVS